MHKAYRMYGDAGIDEFENLRIKTQNLKFVNKNEYFTKKLH